MRGITWKSFYAPPIRVGTIILILQLCLVISFNFTEPSGDYTSAEPKMDLECLNDYITEMMCSLTSDQQLICPEYNVSLFNTRTLQRFTCDLKQRISSSCECTVHVDSGFVLGEEYTFKVLRNENLLFTTNFGTTENIKPTKPVIMTVKETKNGNFLIAWDTIYRIKEPVFSDDLITELTYYIEGTKGMRKNVIVPTKGQYELVGRNLESNSNYIVMARIQSLLNDRFSDYSDPYRFSTPSGLGQANNSPHIVNRNVRSGVTAIQCAHGYPYVTISSNTVKKQSEINAAKREKRNKTTKSEEKGSVENRLKEMGKLL